MIENLAADVTWWITPSIPREVMASFTTGRDEVLGNLRRVFGDLCPDTGRHIKSVKSRNAKDLAPGVDDAGDSNSNV